MMRSATIAEKKERTNVPVKKQSYHLIVANDDDELGQLAAWQVAQTIKQKPKTVLALPTGNTPLGMYRWLVKGHRDGTIDFSTVTTFNLDEFHGIAADNPGSFATYMHRQFFDLVNVLPEHVHLLNSEAEDAESEGRRYEEAIAHAGGIDLAILGIGQNGHIAFNEPGSPFTSQTRLVPLTDQTIDDSTLFFANRAQTPPFALTMGVATIMASRRIILLASSKKKARIVARSLAGDIGELVPASVLQRHPHLTVILDREASTELLDLV